MASAARRQGEKGADGVSPATPTGRFTGRQRLACHHNPHRGASATAVGRIGGAKRKTRSLAERSGNGGANGGQGGLASPASSDLNALASASRDKEPHFGSGGNFLWKKVQRRRPANRRRRRNDVNRKGRPSGARRDSDAGCSRRAGAGGAADSKAQLGRGRSLEQSRQRRLGYSKKGCLSFPTRWPGTAATATPRRRRRRRRRSR